MSADDSLFSSPVFPESEDAAPAEDDAHDAGAPTSHAAAPGGSRAQSVLEHVAAAIVDDPDAVRVSAGSGRTGVVLSLSVAPGDMGRIIGKRGRVAHALRTLVRAAAARDGTDATVDIVD